MRAEPEGQGSRGSLALPWLTLSVTGLLAALYGLMGPAPASWLFDAGAVGGGEIWRVVTGHLVHVDRTHLFWSLLALTILGAVHERFDRGRRGGLVWLSLGAMLTIDLALVGLRPGLAAYAGLSGMLNALLVSSAYLVWRDRRTVLAPIIMALAVAKIGYELITDSALLVTTAWQSVPEAHAAGFAAGVFWALARHFGAPRPCRLESALRSR